MLALIGTVAVSASGGPLRSYAELKFAQGQEYMVLGWEGDKIVGLRFTPNPPWPAGGRLAVFPLSDSDFTTFNMGSPDRKVVRFVLSEQTQAPQSLIVPTADGQVELMKVPGS